MSDFKSFLEQNNIWHKFLTKGSMHSSSDASQNSGIPKDDIAKSLLFKAGNDFWLVIIQGSRKASTKKLRHLLDEKNVRLASAKEVLGVTGYQTGAVPPIGLKNNINCIVDIDVASRESIWAGGGAVDRLVHLKVKDILRYHDAIIEDVKE